MNLSISGDVHTDSGIREKFSKDASSYRIMPKMVAAPKTEEDIVKILREDNPNLEADIEELTSVDKEDDIENMEAEIELREINWKMEEFIRLSGNPFHIAVIKGESAKVIEMIETGEVDINVEDDYGRLSIGYAASMRYKEVVELLIKHGADISKIDHNRRLTQSSHTVGNEVGWGVLHYAAETGDVEMLEFLIGLGADVNMTDREYGTTPFFVAMEYGNVEIVKSLINAGADMTVQNKNGRTFAHEAVYQGGIENIKLLLELGVDINIRDKYGKTLIHEAAHCGEIKNIKLLLDQGADIEVKISSGSTALMMALVEGRSKTVKLLKAHSAMLSSKKDRE